MDLVNLIRTIPDFPSPGILFRDITPLLSNAEALAEAARLMSEPFKHKQITHVVGVEARGFIFGALVAKNLNSGFVPVRKKGSLPAETLSAQYELEYGTATLEIHKDAFVGNEAPKVILVDDVLATGGTAGAGIDLARKAGATVIGATFLVELTELGGRSRLRDLQIESVIRF